MEARLLQEPSKEEINSLKNVHEKTEIAKVLYAYCADEFRFGMFDDKFVDKDEVLEIFRLDSFDGCDLFFVICFMQRFIKFINELDDMGVRAISPGLRKSERGKSAIKNLIEVEERTDVCVCFLRDIFNQIDEKKNGS